ncbi:MAG TPA: DNA adenine methylase [Longimicrobiales bacterium]|nr:DNA adenine methylase [Longimicrobiales bacterium]
MRYIGNKTRLLSFIRGTLRRRGIAGGAALDPFCGTASVARALKRWGFAVTASDIMAYGYVFARAHVAVTQEPDFSVLARTLRLRSARLRAVLHHLDRLPARASFIHEHYSPAGGEGARWGRMYFTPANAARIDAVRHALHEWAAAGLIDADAHDVLLAALIDAADRVANTTGVYAAFVKSWQPNALRPLRLLAPAMVRGNGCQAHREDAHALVGRAGRFDLLYLDPPYNARQYPAYYHIPELLALGWFGGPVATRGKTGLIADGEKRSDWSSSRRCEAAFRALVAAADCRHIVMSYNEEGIIPRDTIERTLREFARAGGFRRYRHSYRRYRSDADSSTRSYRGDIVSEYLYCASR